MQVKEYLQLKKKRNRRAKTAQQLQLIQALALAKSNCFEHA